MFNFAFYRTKLIQAIAEVSNYGKAYRNIADNALWSDEHKRQEQDKLRPEINGKLDEVFTAIANMLFVEVRKAEEAAAFETPWQERTYYATAVQQDIAGRDTRGMLSLYEAVAKTGGNRGYLRELARVLDPILSEAEPVRWNETRLRFMTPEELTAHNITRLREPFVDMLKPIEAGIRGGVETAEKVGSVDLTSYITAFDQVQQNLEHRILTPAIAA